jgi:hypothetical protein
MPPTGAKSSPKNQIDHTHLHSFVADLPLAMKTAGALNQTAVGKTPYRPRRLPGTITSRPEQPIPGTCVHHLTQPFSSSC